MQDDIGAKARYVKAQPQSRRHECHWPGCNKQVRPAFWGCLDHWFKLPLQLRTKIWRAYRPGQEQDMHPSAEYITAAREIQDWIATRNAGSNLPRFADEKG